MKNKTVKKLYLRNKASDDIASYIMLFDLHLIFLRSIKSESETKLDLTMRIEELIEAGFLKDHKSPVFLLKDNRNSNNYFKFEAESEYELFLPRTNTLKFIRRNPVKLKI